MIPILSGSVFIPVSAINKIEQNRIRYVPNIFFYKEEAFRRVDLRQVDLLDADKKIFF